MKGWCGRRWRNLFVTAACADAAAVRAASQRVGIPGTDLSLRTRLDRRPDRQRVAERFLHSRHAGEWEAELPGPPEAKPSLVFCPGLINSMLPRRAFQSALPGLAERGWRIVCADAHPVRSCEANVADLAAAVERGEGLGPDCARIDPGAAAAPGDGLILLGYSKGSPDALTLFAARPDLAGRVSALVGWGGAFGGSFLADDIYDSIEDVDVRLGRIGDVLAMALKTLCPLVRLEGVSERLDEYDIKGAVLDLTTARRERFLAERASELDALDIPVFNITAATTALEVPYVQAQGYLEIRKRDPDNDMQLTQAQARMPGPMAVDLAVLRAHHWDIAYDPFPLASRMGSANLDHPFPREAALTATGQLMTELGLAA